MTWPSWVAQGWVLHGATTLTAVLVGLAVAILVGVFRRGELDQWRVRIAELLAEHDRVSASLSSIDSEYRDARNTIEQAQQIRRDEQALDAVREEVNRTVAELESRLDQKQRQLQGADDKLAEMERLRRATDGLDVEKKRLEAELKKDNELVTRLRDENSRLHDEISKLKKDVSGLEADAREALRTRNRATEECEDAIRKRDNALMERKHLEEELKKDSELHTQFLDERSRLRDEISKLEKKISELQADAQEARSGRKITFPEGPLRVQVDRPKETGPGIDELREIPACLKEVEDYKPMPTDRAVERENEFLHNLERRLEAQNLRYHPRTVKAFHTAVKTWSISPLTVLAGVSGTGKSQLPREYARALGAAFLHVPVEPGWDSPQDLLGFYDYISGQYRATERAQLLVHFDRTNWPDESEPFANRLAVILLDEMNLARTEYYFAELLSRLEMREPDDAVRAESQVAIQMPKRANGEDQAMRIAIPDRVLWTGTLNEDETTQSLSDKVLDRSNTLRFAAPSEGNLLVDRVSNKQSANPQRQYVTSELFKKWCGRKQNDADMGEVKDCIRKIAGAITECERGVGHRVVQAMYHYVRCYPGRWQDAIADQVEMRVLPKLNGSEDTDRLRKGLDRLQGLVENVHDDDLVEALKTRINAIPNHSTFTWLGVDRTRAD